jgi:hypothetical protein
VLRGITSGQVRNFQIIYYLLVGILILAVLALALTNTVQLDCEKVIYSYHWFILDTIDTI